MLVEGSDDKRVVKSIAEHFELAIDFDVKATRGFTGIIDGVRGHWPGKYKVIGLIVDADEDVTNRWGYLSRQLRKSPVMKDLPSTPEPKGTIIPGQPRLGIWIMPDNTSAGELEDFIARMIPQPDSIWPRAEAYIDEIPEAERRFPSHKALRATVNAWLAAQSRPRPMWDGIGEGDLRIEPNSQAFLDWLNRLFGDDIP